MYTALLKKKLGGKLGAMHHQNCNKTTLGARVTTCFGLPNPKRFLEYGAFNAKN